MLTRLLSVLTFASSLAGKEKGPESDLDSGPLAFYLISLDSPPGSRDPLLGGCVITINHRKGTGLAGEGMTS